MPVEAAAPSVPAWRQELSEKVRAIRAKRNAPGSQVDTLIEEAVRTFDADLRGSLPNVRLEEERTMRAPIRHEPRAEPREHIPSTPAPTRRTSSNIVEAALTRVKRASENASRAALPKIEPARPVQSSAQVGLIVDRQATARALAPIPEVEPVAEIEPAINPEIVQAPIVKREPADFSLPDRTIPDRTIEEAVAAPAPVKSPAIVQTAIVDEPIDTSSMPVIDDLEPLDYLEAEIRKVDAKLGAEFLKNESPSILIHAMIGFVDLVAIAISCSPFLAIIRIADGSFLSPQTRLSSGIIVGLISFFYLALTQCLCGRTFGMMLTNTRVVDAANFEAPSAPRSLLSTAGYFVAAAPLLLGLIWAAFNHKHRGWHDFVSGTVVVRDF